VDQALLEAGGCGKFIIFITVTMIIAMTSGGLLVDGLPLLQMAPVYNCYDCYNAADPLLPSTAFRGEYVEGKGGVDMCPMPPGATIENGLLVTCPSKTNEN
jgi:hypothetical protein